MFRHHDITDEPEVQFFANLRQLIHKYVSSVFAFQQGLSSIAAKRNEVKMSSAVDASQSGRHLSPRAEAVANIRTQGTKTQFHNPNLGHPPSSATILSGYV